MIVDDFAKKTYKQILKWSISHTCNNDIHVTTQRFYRTVKMITVVLNMTPNANSFLSKKFKLTENVFT